MGGIIAGDFDFFDESRAGDAFGGFENNEGRVRGGLFEYLTGSHQGVLEIGWVDTGDGDGGVAKAAEHFQKFTPERLDCTKSASGVV